MLEELSAGRGGMEVRGSGEEIDGMGVGHIEIVKGSH